MKPALLATLALCAMTPAAFHGQTFADPANLMGERVKPGDGRELPIDKGARGLEQLLRKLNTRASLMMIVAHPDDEDGGLLTLYSRGVGARVADLSLTRGEGGQNAMTGDFEDALGLLRTQELLSSDRYTGVDQFFGTEVDFGFSKTKEEAFSKWTHERVLYDAVRAVRLYRPLVIVTVWAGGVTDGHGQHQVSGQIAQEVFKAAGDPKVFPEMITEGILPWQPLKVYARVPSQSITPEGLYDYATGQYTTPRFINYVTGEVSTTTPRADVIVHEGKADPLLSNDATPRSYIQFARLGLAQQKSQIGPGVRPAPSGAFDVAYHRYGSMLAEQPEHEESLFDGIDTSVAALSEIARQKYRPILLEVQNSLAKAANGFDRSNPGASASMLADAYTKLMSALGKINPGRGNDDATQAEIRHELQVKRVQLSEALSLALDLHVEGTADSSVVVSGQPIKVRIHVTSANNSEIRLEMAGVYRGKEHHQQCMAEGEAQPTGSIVPRPFLGNELTRTCLLPGQMIDRVSRPYFGRKNIERPFYTIADAALRNSPSTPPPLILSVVLEYKGAYIDVEQVVRHDRQPVQIVPAASVGLSAHAQVSPDGKPVRVTAYVSSVSSPLLTPHFVLPQGWTTSTVATSGTQSNMTTVLVEPPAKAASPALLQVNLLPQHGEGVDEGYRAVGYGDLPTTNYFTAAVDTIIPVPLDLPLRTRIGYLPGTGDAVPDALASVGLKPTMLTVADLTPDSLKRFDTVLLGVRTYNAHPDLHGVPTQALLDFARAGGNVVVQYQTPEFTAADAPFPLSLGSNEKVVDETAPVALIDPSASLLRSPNVITAADFNGWVEERGHGFLGSWDSHYTALTETHDPGAPAEFVKPQEPQRGGLITVKLGAGRWTYCAFALYRQLPEAIPGAFRLIANLIAH